MTDPSQFGNQPEGWLPPAPPPAGYPPPPAGYPPAPVGYPPPLGYGMAPAYGFHPITGEPLSDRSKTTAGMLQLLGIIGVLGIGRIYQGRVTLGVVQLILGLVLYCIGVGVIWGIVDAIVLMTGSPRDQFGRLLRDGA